MIGFRCEATQHLIRRLETEGEVSARLFVSWGMADSCKALAYRLYDVCESSRPGWLGRTTCWPRHGPKFSASQPKPHTQTAEAQQLDL